MILKQVKTYVKETKLNQNILSQLPKNCVIERSNFQGKTKTIYLTCELTFWLPNIIFLRNPLLFLSLYFPLK
ncbi:hypothetical protein YC2023_063975 [Brassica napus]